MREALHKYRPAIFCTGILCLLSFFGCIMVAVRDKYLGGQNCTYLVWNLFLAWIPLGLSLLMSYMNFGPENKRKLYAFLYGLTRLKLGMTDLKLGNGKIETDEG